MENSLKDEKTKVPTITLDNTQLRDHVSGLVRQSVEDTLNALLDAEADMLCKAQKYERNDERVSTRAGHNERDFQTIAGSVRLRIPKLRQIPFETQIIERYKRRESSIEEALVEMYLAGVSVRRIEDITEALWGSRVSPATVSELNKKVYSTIEAWRNRPLDMHYPYVFVDGIWLKRSWGGEVESVSVLVAIGVNEQGYREIIGVAEGMKEDRESWRNFLRYLKQRGLQETELVISDKSLGLIEVLGEFYPKAKWQRCVVHFYRNVLSATPKGKAKSVALMLKAIHAQEDKEAARQKALEVISKLEAMRLQKAAAIVKSGYEETLSYYSFPCHQWRSLKTNNPLERINREIRRRTRVVGNFPDGESALMLVAARLRYIAANTWGTKRYMKMGEEAA